MSYVDNISPENIADYIKINNWQTYYKKAVDDLKALYPDGDVSDAELTVNKKIFTQAVTFEGEYEANIKFRDCYFLAEVSFYKSVFKGNLSINHSFCDDEFYIFKGAIFEKDFDIITLIVKRQLYVQGGTFAKCRWSFGEWATVKISGGSYENINIGYWGGAKLKELTLDVRTTSGYINVSGEGTYIKNFLVFQSSRDLEISIEDVNVNVLSIYRYRNEKGFRLINIKPFADEKPSELSITESFMGKAEFYLIDLRDFEFLTIYNSHLIDSTFVNIDWKTDIQALKGSSIGLSEIEEQLPPKLSKLSIDWFAENEKGEALRYDKSIITYFKNQRETFRQLKYALGKQGDIINEQKFHTQEMLAYDRSLSIEEGFWTVAIIKFSYWFSDFGQSVSRPFWGLMGGHLILLFLLIKFNGIPGLSVCFGNPNFSGFELSFQKYFYLINPLRKFEDTAIGYNIIIDILMRIWASYMLYNLIRATRRFIK